MKTFLKLDCVLNLKMRDEYLLQKALGRRVCNYSECKKGFNVEYVRNEVDGVDMPPLLPDHGDRSICECGRPLSTREDDKEDIIKSRLSIYKKETFPLVEYYRKQGILKTLEIKRGLKDFPKILALVSNSDSGSTTTNSLNNSKL